MVLRDAPALLRGGAYTDIQAGFVPIVKTVPWFEVFRANLSR